MKCSDDGDSKIASYSLPLVPPDLSTHVVNIRKTCLSRTWSGALYIARKGPTNSHTESLWANDFDKEN